MRSTKVVLRVGNVGASQASWTRRSQRTDSPRQAPHRQNACEQPWRCKIDFLPGPTASGQVGCAEMARRPHICVYEPALSPHPGVMPMTEVTRQSDPGNLLIQEQLLYRTNATEPARSSAAATLWAGESWPRHWDVAQGHQNAPMLTILFAFGSNPASGVNMAPLPLGATP